MAQTNFLWDDDARVVSGINGNTTSAITAGDILYASAPSTSPFGTTAPATDATIYDEIEVEPVKFATALTQGKQAVGIALQDAAAGSPVPFATRGLFFSPVIDTTGAIPAGWPVRAAQGETTVGVAKCGTTAGPTVAENLTWLGRALTGANVDAEYVVWLLNIR